MNAYSNLSNNHTRQLLVFAALLAVNAFLAFLVYALGLQEGLAAGQTMPVELASIPDWLMGLANAGIILLLYGILGLLGYWFAVRLGLPGVYREGAGWRAWFWMPLALGAAVGVAITLLDRVFASLSEWPGFTHPGFPLSIFASGTAGIGEEIIFRMFVFGLWAFLLNLLLGRLGAARLALWIANLIAALAFAAGHLPALMFLYGLSDPFELPGLVLTELFLLNGLVGLMAGERYMKVGLVAAVGVHFWADIVWHVIFPLL